MAYSEDLRKKAVEYVEKGHSQRKTADTFGISRYALQQWLKLKEETGSLSKKPQERKPKKLHPELLKAYLQDHPDAYLQEIGDAFGCSDTAVMKAFKRLGITRKKRQSGTANKILS